MSLKNQTFICFDIETTGLSPLNHDIIELGAVKFSISNGIIDQFNSFIATDKVIPNGVIQIHGITNDMIKDAPNLTTVLQDFLNFLDNSPLLAHNASFDTSFIGYQLNRLHLDSPTNLIFDTISIFRKIIPGLPSYSLSNLKTKFEVYAEHAHRAHDDAIATMDIFTKFINHYERNKPKRLSQLKTIAPPILFSQFTKKLFKFPVETIEKINGAIKQKQKILISYRDKDNIETSRQILASNVLLRNGFIYLSGFCFLRQEDRKFRLDRISKIEILDDLNNLELF